jgi:hypothetical protein
MMAVIMTKRGQEIIVDAEDAEMLVAYGSWFISAHGYAESNIRGARGEIMKMHRLLMGMTKGDGLQIDHINGNKLDNRRSNLRVCVIQQNSYNRGRQTDNTSGYKGVSRDKRKKINPWRATIGHGGRKSWLGYFATPEHAHEFYSLAADMLHGEFANPGQNVAAE